MFKFDASIDTLLDTSIYSNHMLVPIHASILCSCTRPLIFTFSRLPILFMLAYLFSHLPIHFRVRPPVLY